VDKVGVVQSWQIPFNQSAPHYQGKLS